jgi:methyltransferase (TIGR00027 family)
MAVRGIGQADDSPISKSAMLLVTACAVVSKDPVYARTFQDPYAAWFAAAISDEAAERLPTLDDLAARAAFIEETERDLDGLVTHVVYRKPWITDRVRGALEAGIGQLVILGAGCDTLSLRLEKALAGVEVFEFDRTPVIDFRRRVLGQHGALAENVRLLTIDFDEDDLGTVLGANGFDRDKPAIIVAEAVVEYLTGDGVEGLFASARRMGAPDSRLIFTFLANKVYEPGKFDTLRDRLDEGGESLKFGLVPSEIEHFLDARGFRFLEMATPETIEREIVPLVGAPVGIIPGWHLVLAERHMR